MAEKLRRKRKARLTSQGSAYLFVWVAQSPKSPPQMERVEILSERNPTRMFAAAGSGAPPPSQLILVTSATGRDYISARAKLIRRIQRTQSFVWLLPWVEHWEGRSSRPSPSREGAPVGLPGFQTP